MIAQLFVLGLLATSGNVSVDAVYPNPSTDGDAGEFVVLDVPEDGVPADLVLTDGEETVNLSGIARTGRIAVTDDSTLTTRILGIPVVEVEAFLSLRNGGEEIHLRSNERVVSSLSYPRGPEAELYRNGTWHRPGRTSIEPVLAEDVAVTTFVLPDDPDPVRTMLQDADERILVAGYTFTDPTVTRQLIDAHRRGVEVRVLLEGGPVGGISDEQIRAVERLTDADVPVAFMGTPMARYDFHHAKYAVVDGSVVVTSENWKPGGIGGHGSRGWAVTLEDERTADELAAVFEADSRWLDSQNWTGARPTNPKDTTLDHMTFPTRFEGREFRAERTTVLVAPDNVEGELRDCLREADESIAVQQVSIDRDGVLLGETLAAARRGVSVRILVSGAWFVESENRDLVEHLRTLTDREDLPLSARVVEPRSRYEYVHNKGLIVDDRVVVVGSLNWNSHARTRNREVVVLIEDPEVAAYYERVFRADWRGSAWRIPWGFVLIALLTTGVSVGFAKKVGQFVGR